MRYLVAFMMLALFAGCGGTALVSARPGYYSVKGYTHSPEEAMAVASQNFVNEQNSSRYWKAVDEGRAFAYQGGWGSDYELFYGNTAPMPVMVSPPAEAPAKPSPAGAAVDKAEAAYERATDALKILKRLEAKQRKGENR